MSNTLGLPSDIRDWQDDDLLVYLLSEGCDLPGNIVVGDRALENVLRRNGAPDVGLIPASERSVLFPSRAEEAQRGAVRGSSAGGEQPKFLTSIRRDDGRVVTVIVKFSAPDESPVSRRWADLLLCEHIASGILTRHRIQSSHTQTFDSGGRRFLEIERFDRFPGGGRRGMLTLGALEDGLAGAGPKEWSWATAAAALESTLLIDEACADELRWRWCFGELIGNTDMHRSNTSFWLDDAEPFGLTPSYDMLPMLYAPGAQGDMGVRTFKPRPPVPALEPVRKRAAVAATEFWSSVIADGGISAEFHAVAGLAALEVDRLARQFRTPARGSAQ